MIIGLVCDLGDFCNRRCGFAQTQEAYDRAVNELFGTLDKLEDHLASSRYLCGDTLTLVDICLFTTLIRFDVAYNVLFKCTKKKLYEYPNLHAYLRDIYQVHAHKGLDFFINCVVNCNFWLNTKLSVLAMDRFPRLQKLAIS